jgi:hypothetical protein
MIQVIRSVVNPDKLSHLGHVSERGTTATEKLRCPQRPLNTQNDGYARAATALCREQRPSR